MTASEGESGGQRGSLPAVDDRPHGADGASWWPIFTASGAVGFVVGVAVYIVGTNAPVVVNPDVGIVLSFVGFLAAAGGISAWVYHGFIARYEEKTADATREKYLWGMLLYMPAEIALFGAGMLYFTFVYVGSWPPGDLPPMLTTLVWAMTAALLASSFTIYFAGRELRKENDRRFLALLGVTPVLGILFLVGKAANYYRLIVQEGYGIGSGIYWTALFATSGLHGILVAVGIVMLLVVFARALAGHYTPEQHVSLTEAGMYWWMLEAVWLLLIVELYATVELCRASGTC